jgi:hypothetical protein
MGEQDEKWLAKYGEDPHFDLAVKVKPRNYLDSIDYHEQVAPSGVTVRSQVPFIPWHWSDNPVLHIVWSYSSWITLILQGDPLRWKAPRRFFEKRMCR